MRYLNSFKDIFLKEELVTGLRKIDKYSSNIFSSVFNDDQLALREFIQSRLGLKNLKFIGNGAIGLAFTWEDKVIKFTTDINEKKGVEKLIGLSTGSKKLPGFAKYYWIKEVSLPLSNIRKLDWREPGIEEKIKKKRVEGKKLSDDTTLTPEEIQKRVLYEKVKMAYIICMEKLTGLSEKDQEIARLILGLISVSQHPQKQNYLIPGKDNKQKLKKLIDWLKSDEEVYKEEDFINGGFDKIPIFGNFDDNNNKGLTRKAFLGSWIPNRHRIWYDMPRDYFMQFSTKIINIYKYGNRYGISTSDIHVGNLGYSDGELVAFDCM